MSNTDTMFNAATPRNRPQVPLQYRILYQYRVGVTWETYVMLATCLRNKLKNLWSIIRHDTCITILRECSCSTCKNLKPPLVAKAQSRHPLTHAMQMCQPCNWVGVGLDASRARARARYLFLRYSNSVSAEINRYMNALSCSDFFETYVLQQYIKKT